jgi:hypothetical protein
MSGLDLTKQYRDFVASGMTCVSVDFGRRWNSLVWIGSDGRRVRTALDPEATVEAVCSALKRLQTYCRRQGRPFEFTIYP